MIEEKKRMVAAERDSMIGMFRMLDLMAQTNDQNEKTVSRVKNGLRNYRTIMTKLENMCKEVFMTVPLEQMHQIKRQMQQSYLRLTMYGDVGRKDDGTWVVDNNDIVALITMAAKGECMLCDGKRKNCVLARLMEELPVQVNDTFLVACKGGI